ncbi:hypothetical protein SAMN05421505_11243 [Sinosporangium album]|uniref:Uncharacterized protein n=1 Tax=Sinosporangium album TaxID=504805 RepID=A0A1G8A7D2_9ACTN|nr:hypothetical protein [Sinosporangium album]SDH16793.1 hypothetical protein SAMN05421505_11243 [Sinosporangium album]
MTHPKRFTWAQKVAAAVRGRALSIVMDPDPNGTPSALRTSLAAWSTIEPGATHHVVVHDDMVLSDTLFERAENAIRAMPHAALALFAFWNSRNGAAVRIGALTGSRWVSAVNEYTPCTALILPRDVAAGYVEFAGKLHGTWPEDVLMYRFLRLAGVRTFVGVPNLAEHEDLNSLSGNDFQGLRRSACFPSLDASGSEPVEDPVLDSLSVVPFFKNGRAQVALRVPGSRRPRWQNVECEQYLERLGTPAAVLRPRRLVSVPGVDTAAVRGTWLTAYALGLAAGITEAEREAGPYGARPDPMVVEQALATLGPGGLCHVLPAGALNELPERLGELVRTGVTAGREAADRLTSPGGAVRRDRRGQRVAVLDGNSPLGEYLTRGLADRGHRVTSVGSRTPDGAHPDIEYAVADLDEPEELSRALAGSAWVVDITGLTAPAAAEPLPLPEGTVRIRKLGDGSRETAADGSWTLHPGELYGPGCSRGSRLGRMVWDALLNRPIDTGDDGVAELRLLHVKDLADVVSAVLEGHLDDRELVVANDVPHRVGDLAEVIRRIVRPVLISPPGPAGAAEGEPVPPSATPCLPLRDGVVDVEYGIHTFAQWLAYEAEFSIAS